MQEVEGQYTDSAFIFDIIPNIRDYINLQNNEGYTPLMLAIKESNYVFAARLIKEGADTTITNKKGNKASDLLDKSYRV